MSGPADLPAGPAAEAGAAAPAALSAENPWPGLAAYDERSREFFFGRGDEARELLRLIRIAPLTVLYGKSGLGKTSLLQAGLFPLLRGAHFLPVHIRLAWTGPAEEPPLRQALSRLVAELDAAQAEYPAPAPDEGLWEFLHRRDLELWSPDNFLLVPVLVFDQFEELFSRAGATPERVKLASDELADLIENRIPPELAGTEAAPRRAALDLAAQRYRILLSFREDFLPDLRAWERKIPSLFQHALRLEPMSRQRAIEAVSLAGAAVLDAGVAAQIVDLVGAPERGAPGNGASAIEPVLLSLCCYRLNRRRGDGARIDRTLVEQAGQDIMEGFYRDALEDPDVAGPPDAGRFVEDQLVQGGRFRGDYPREEALSENRITARQLEILTDRHRLLRIVERADTARIELIHDRLVPIVRRAKLDRRAREAKAEAEKERARSSELEAQRNAARRGGRIAAGLAAIALACALLACFALTVAWKEQARAKAEELKALAEERTALAEQEQKERIRLTSEVAMKASRFGQGSLAAGRVPDEEAMYVALGLYRLSLSGDPGLSRFYAAGLTALRNVLGMSDNRLDRILRESGWHPTAALAYSPDRRTLAVGGDDGAVRLLDAATYAQLAELNCRTAEPVIPWTASFNQDGTRLAIGYARPESSGQASPAPGLLCVYEMAGHTLVRRWPGPDRAEKIGDIIAVSFVNRPGADLVAAGGGGVVRLLDVGTGATTDLPGNEGDVYTVAASGDGRTIMAGGVDGAIRVWQLGDGAKAVGPPTKLTAHDGPVQHIIGWPGDPSLAISGGDDGYVVVWNLTAMCEVRRSRQQYGRVLALAAVPDRSDRNAALVSAAEADGTIALFRLEPTKACAEKAAGSSPENRTDDGSDAVEYAILAGHGDAVFATGFGPDGTRLTSVAKDGSMRAWALDRPAVALASRPLLPELAGAHLTALSVSPDDRLIAAGDDHGYIHLWHGIADGSEPSGARFERSADWRAYPGQVQALAFARLRDRMALLSVGQNGSLQQWDPESHKRSDLGLELAGPSLDVSSIAVWTPGQGPSRIAAGEHDGTIHVWDPATGRLLRRFDKPTGAGHDDEDLNVVGFTGDGRYVAAASYGTLRLLDLDDGTEAWPEGMTDISLMASGQGRWLLTSTKDQTIREWDESTLRSRRSDRKTDLGAFKALLGFGAHGYITSMDATPDGTLIIAGRDNGDVELWDGTEEALLGGVLQGHEHRPVIAVALARDGELFATADEKGVVVWPGPKRWAAMICARLNENMTRKEWNSWISPGIPYVEQCPGLRMAADPQLEQKQ